MKMTPVSKRGELEYRFQKINKGNEESFKDDLLKASPAVLKSCLKALDIKGGSTKEEMVDYIIGEVVKGIATPQPKALKIVVDKQLKAMIPRPSKEDMERLKKSIEEKGFRSDLEKIKVLPDGRIVDGFSRYDVLTALKIPLTDDMIEIINLKDSEIEGFMHLENIARRHLSDIEAIAMVQKYLPQIKQEVVKEKVEKKKATDKEKKDAPAEKKKEEKPKAVHQTREKVAEIAGTSPAQVKLFDFIKAYAPDRLDQAKENKESLGAVYKEVKAKYDRIKSVDPELIQMVKDGSIKLDEAYTKVGPPSDKKPLGKCGQVVKDVLGIYEKILMKRLGKDKIVAADLDEHQVEFIERLKIMLKKYMESGK